jgi:hypothetical protein
MIVLLKQRRSEQGLSLFVELYAITMKGIFVLSLLIVAAVSTSAGLYWSLSLSLSLLLTS